MKTRIYLKDTSDYIATEQRVIYSKNGVQIFGPSKLMNGYHKTVKREYKYQTFVPYTSIQYIGEE